MLRIFEGVSLPTGDGQLVQRCLEGDHRAFDELVERYRARVFHAALNKVGMREDAADIAQEAFVRAYMSLHSLKDPSRFAPWLMVICGNLCKMRFRRSREIVAPVDSIDLACEDQVDHVSAHASEALHRLPSGTRAAARLFFVDELTQTEIAAQLGISVPAVKARVRDARVRLRKEMVDMVRHTAKNDGLDADFDVNLKLKLELARWYRTIAEHCGSGGDLMTGLQAIHSDEFSPSLMEATGRMMDAIRGGRSVTDALAEIPVLASPEASAMMRAGERFGSLHVAARVLADWLEVQGAQRRIELIFWCRTLGFLLAADVPMAETLSGGVDIAHSKALRQATREMMQTLEAIGEEQPAESPIRCVLDRYPDVFPPILKVSMLAGEWIGMLDHALIWAAGEMADDLALSVASDLLGQQRKLTPGQPGILRAEERFPERCVQLLSDAAPDIRAAAIDVLGRFDWKGAAADIAACLDDESAEVRRLAARAVAKLGFADAEVALVRCLDDPDPSVRRMAIESIAELELHGAASALVEAIRDSDPRVILSAIESLQALQETEFLERAAIAMLASDDWEDQKRAAYLLRYFLPQEIVESLVAGLPEELSLREMDAVIALGLYGCAQARPILNRLVGDFRVAGKAARALREIGDASSAAAIRSAVDAGLLEPRFSEIADKMEQK